MSLQARLQALIATEGPIPVSTFMTLCLHDPAEGYYATRPGLGRDFITAPETSQLFGELLGLWLAHEWDAMGRPEPVILAEAGPGRGTLMADALRAISVAKPALLGAMDVCLIEASVPLRALQAETLAACAPRHAATLDAIGDGPLLLIANEFLDCLPARQFLHDARAWHERVIGLDADGRLAFGLAADRAPPAGARASRALDLQPALETLVAGLAVRKAPLRALFIDYGPAGAAPGDTLRAYRGGAQVDPLSEPGHADLTVDVDFARFARLAAAAGLDVAGPLGQGPVLGALGIQARLDRLVAAHPGEAEALFAGARRLVDPAEMGARFKAIALSSPGLPPPAGF